MAPRNEIDEDMVDGDDGSVVQAARALPEPKKPTREEVARHNINHLPYRNWCPHCVSCRRSNAAHPSKSSAERTLPLFVSDYCFVRKADESLVTVLVGKLYPSRSAFASVCDAKGPDDSVTDRLAAFFRETGHSHIVYKNDQEPAREGLKDGSNCRRLAENLSSRLGGATADSGTLRLSCCQVFG